VGRRRKGEFLAADFPCAATDTRSTRRAFVERGLVAGGALAAGGAVLGWRAGAAAPAPSAALDKKIFNFALLLEYLQAGFYTEAVDAGGLRGEVRNFAEVVADHERKHVAYLEQALGRGARKKPTFEFGSATRDQQRFVETAVLLENIGVEAYNGQAANLTKKSLAAAAQIVSVEGRHAAWISALAGEHPAPRAADPGASADDVAMRLRATGFIKGS
jgi:rubrerythrin